MANWPKDNQTARNAFYGDPGKGEISGQMVPVTPPFAMYYEGKRVNTIMFHRKCAAALLAALNEIWDYCQHDQAKIDASGASKYFGAYNHRKVRGSETKWSNHAYAAAIDLNAGQNALGKVGNMPDFIVDAFVRQGAMWGGWYQSRPDWMHFEFVDNGGRQPKSAPPVPGVAEPVTAKPIPTVDRRSRMGAVILGYEARRDGKGRLAVYKLPANDGGGTYEVAGINDRYHPVQAAHLRDLIQSGKYDEAEASAVEYMVKYTDAASGWSTNAGVEFYLRDCVFNRGPTGAAKILQMALGVGVDGNVGTETRDALSKIEPGALLDKLRAARERYEDQVAGPRPNLRAGLVNRWNKALADARKFAAETPTATQKNTADLVKGAVVAGGAAGAATGAHQGWGVFEWSMLAGGLILLVAIGWAVWRYGWPAFKAWRAREPAYYDAKADEHQSTAEKALPPAGDIWAKGRAIEKKADKVDRNRRLQKKGRAASKKAVAKKKPAKKSTKRKAA